MFSADDLTALILGDAKVDGLDASSLREACHEIARARGMLDALDAGLVARSNELHAAGAGPAPGELFVLTGHVSGRDARTTVARASTIASVPELAAALGDGAVSAAHADAITRVAGRLDLDVKDEFLARGAQLVAVASKLPPETFEKHCKQIADTLTDGGVGELERQRRATRLRHWIDRATGMYQVRGELDPETGHQLFTALDAEIERMWHAPDAETARRHACCAGIIPVVMGGDGIPLDMGRKRRLATPDQRRALRTMYRTCAFHGCDVAFTRCQPHHLREGDDHHGPTDLDNLLPLCHRHHHLVHEGRWRLSLDAHRTLTITRPDGTLHAAVPFGGDASSRMMGPAPHGPSGRP